MMKSIATFALCLLVGTCLRHSFRPSTPEQVPRVSVSARPIPPVEDFPQGFEELKRGYESFVWNQDWVDYGSWSWADDDVEVWRQKFVELGADLLVRQAKVGQAYVRGVNVREEMGRELTEIFYCELEYTDYEAWLEDMAHFEYLPHYLQSIQEFLEPEGEGSSRASYTSIASRSFEFRAHYSSFYLKSRARYAELLSDAEKQMQLPMDHDVTGLKAIVELIQKATDIRQKKVDEGNLSQLVEFLLPLLRDYLPTVQVPTFHGLSSTRPQRNETVIEVPDTQFKIEIHGPSRF